MSSLCIPASLAGIIGFSDLKQIKAVIMDPKGLTPNQTWLHLREALGFAFLR
ncbi:MAG: hypothetical protein MK106_01520 [Mariniblastus sp.]|nr:hypothetical protein [Mariniblastus sp.]